MITGRVLSRCKRDGTVVIKNSFIVHSSHNISHGYLKKNSIIKCRTLLSVYNDRSFSTIQHNNVHPLLGSTAMRNIARYDNNHITFGRTGLLNHAEAVTKSIRHYSSGLPLIESRLPSFYTGIFKDISESVPVEYMQDALISLHSLTNLPWWATIVLATVLIRTTITFPIMIYQQYILAKVQNLTLEMKEITKRTEMEVAYGTQHLHWSPSYAKHYYMKSIREEWNNLILRDNCHPLKSAVVIVIQLPIWVTLSFALRNICLMLPPYNDSAFDTYMQFTTGGIGWISNLTVADPSFTLPLLLGLSNLCIIEVQHMMRIKEETKVTKYLTNFFRIVTIVLVPLSAFVPSCLTLFWATSSVTGLLHHIMLLSPKIRRVGGVPKTSTELQHPYAELHRRIKDRFRFKEQAGSPTNL